MKSEPPRLLLADDQPDVLEALRLLLKPEGYALETAASPQQILRALKMKDFDVVLMDLNYARDTTSGERRASISCSGFTPPTSRCRSW